jgi:hypothetical protein
MHPGDEISLKNIKLLLLVINNNSFILIELFINRRFSIDRNNYILRTSHHASQSGNNTT